MTEINSVAAPLLDAAEVLQVIRTTLTRRGAGKDLTDPIRVVTQFWSFKGELLAEVDPFPDSKFPSTATHGRLA